MGGFKNNSYASDIFNKMSPPPDRCFATATLPTLASLAGEG